MLNSQDVPECVQRIEWVDTGKTNVPLILAASARNVKLFALKDKSIDKQVTATKMLDKGKGLVIPKPKKISTQK